MNNITATSTIEKCREIFSRFGIPRILVTDNGRTFVSQEFQDFVREWNRSQANGSIPSGYQWISGKICTDA